MYALLLHISDHRLYTANLYLQLLLVISVKLNNRLEVEWKSYGKHDQQAQVGVVRL